MTVGLLLEVALDFAYVTLFLVTLISFVRRRSATALAVVAVFGSVTLLYGAATVGRLWPSVAVVTGIASLLAFVALPYFTLRLVARFRHVSVVVRRLVAVLFIGYATLTIVIAAGVDLRLGDTGNLVLLVSLLVYFVLVEAVGAAMFALEARRRGGASRSRLATAAVSTGLLSCAALVLTIGGLATIGDETAADLVGVLVQVLALGAALAYLVAFAPPGWLRRISQHATGYAFVRDLNQLPTGVSPVRIWELLAAVARAATGGSAAKVTLDSHDGGRQVIASGNWPRDASGVPLSTGVASPGRGGGARVLSIPMSLDGRAVGSLEVLLHGDPLFVDDDVELLTLLASQAIRVADRGQLLAERERLIGELQAASAAKSDFLAAMSHELRTPLNAIIGFSELLLLPPSDTASAAGDPGTLTQYAGHIHDAGLNLLELINEVLDLARVEAGRPDLRPARFDLDDLLVRTLETMRPLADRKSVRLSYQGPGPLELDADQKRIRQVVFNLLSNAVKFTPDGGAVTVALSVDGSDARLVVSDTGPGIAPADQARVFEAFQQAGDRLPGAVQGTGLGLALARQLVEAHNGRIELESTIGAGSRFSVVLPVAPPAAARPPAESAAAGSARPLVLVIEDEPSAAELLRVYLDDAGYAVAVATDGATGLAWAADLHPVAVILDILLPDIDGWEVLQRLKRLEPTHAVPVIVVSVIDDAPLGLALGAVDYFVKPVGRDALLESLGRLTFTTKVRTRPVTILVIDDDPDALTGVRELLEPVGFTVVGSTTGTAGLDFARSAHPDLILLDLALPHDDGFELVTRLKADPATQRIPVWVTTSSVTSAADKARLNGHVLGFVERGGGTLDALSEWLGHVVAAPPIEA